jgi:glycerophosphoryl diester phosphodiesterase
MRILPAGSHARRLLLAALAILAGAAAYLCLYEPRYRGNGALSGRTLIFAHRGLGNYGPDNSLYAVKQAYTDGFDGVDVDGQLTRDGKIVIFHDLSIDRLTSGAGRVSGHTLDELLRLDLAPRFKPGMTGAFVAPFEEFVRESAGKGILMVELKVPSAAPTGIEEEAARIIREHGAHDRVFLSSFNPIVLNRLKRLDPGIRTVLIFMDTNWNAELRAEIREGDLVDLPWFLRQEPIRRAIRKIIRPDYLSVNHEVAEATTDRLLARGWPVFLWTPDTPEDIARAAAKRPYGVISNEPYRAREIVGAAAPR